LKEGPEPGEDDGGSEAKLAAKEEAVSLPVTEIIAEDRLLGQGESAPEGEAADEEKGGEEAEDTGEKETEEAEAKKPVTSEEAEEAGPHESAADEGAKEPEGDMTAEGSDGDGEPILLSDDDAGQESKDSEEKIPVEEPEEEVDELFASLDDETPAPEADGAGSAGDDDEDDLEDLIKMSAEAFDE